MTRKRKRTPVTSLLCRGPYWLWKLLYTISPYHRGYDAGYLQMVKNVSASAAVARDVAEHRRTDLDTARELLYGPPPPAKPAEKTLGYPHA